MTLYWQNVPWRAQMNEPTIDNLPDENRAANCVPAALGSGLSYLTGRPYYGDQLKDAVYGQGYTGGTDPARFIEYVQQQGCRMVELAGGSYTATARIIAEIKRGALATGAIPSAWGSVDAAYVAAHPETSTHEVLWNGYDDMSDTLTAMNPMIGGVAGWHTASVEWWASRIVYNRMFTLEQGMLDITQAAGFFTATDATHWTCKQNGKVIALGMLKTYRDMAALGTLAGLTALGLPLENEWVPQPNTAVQRFERGILVWDPGHVIDRAPGQIGDFFLAHIDDAKLNTQLAALSGIPQAELDAANARTASAEKALTDYKGAVTIWAKPLLDWMMSFPK